VTDAGKPALNHARESERPAEEKGMYFLIAGFSMLLIWGFDFKYDQDFFTWIWFYTGIINFVIGFLRRKK